MGYCWSEKLSTVRPLQALRYAQGDSEEGVVN